MKDMLGTDIQVDDVVLFPGGNARYGGLNITVGVVKKMTAKRLSLITGNLVPDGKKYKATNKTGAKVLVCTDPQVLASDQVQALRVLTRTERADD